MWLLKTEPSAYGYDDLERDGHARPGTASRTRSPSRTCGR